LREKPGGNPSAEENSKQAGLTDAAKAGLERRRRTFSADITTEAIAANREAIG